MGSDSIDLASSRWQNGVRLNQWSLTPLKIHIYRSGRKVDTYLYLLDKDDFSVLPEDLLKLFGDPEFSFSFELTRSGKLAMEDASAVYDNLESQGYHLQLQNELQVEQMLEMKALN
jgi:hypothetical protein